MIEPQTFERSWWGDCTNTHWEERKQITYAQRMGLVLCHDPEQRGRWPLYDLQGRSVLDIGGGPVSMLLKCINGGPRVVVDPCEYPEWVDERYKVAGITWWPQTGEWLDAHPQHAFDEAWIYNVLQHVVDPQTVIRGAMKHARVIRLFEWVDIPPHAGHPHELKAEKLDEWLGTPGHVEWCTEPGCHGKCYFGVFSV